MLLRVSEDGSRRIPVFHDLGMPFAEVRRLAVFLFCVPYFVIRSLSPSVTATMITGAMAG